MGGREKQRELKIVFYIIFSHIFLRRALAASDTNLISIAKKQIIYNVLFSYNVGSQATLKRQSEFERFLLRIRFNCSRFSPSSTF